VKIPEEFIQDYRKIENYCAGQEHCEFDVRLKLQKHGLPSEIINSFIQKLTDEKYIDNIRYCESYIHDHIYIKRWGKLKIKAHLRGKQISSQTINTAINSIPDEIYIDNLIYLLNRKKQGFAGKISDPKIKAKIMRYLASNGYESDLIFNLEF
jgi:regulatory protein